MRFANADRSMQPRRLFRTLLPVGAALALTACSGSSPSPMAATTTLAATVQDIRLPSHAFISQTYAVWSTEERRYLTGAVLTITTSVSELSYVAAGPHAQVTAPVPSADNSVHIVITYRNYCFDQDVTVLKSQTPGPPPHSGTWLYPTTQCPGAGAFGLDESAP
jgi:hypothetical protein